MIEKKLKNKIMLTQGPQKHFLESYIFFRLRPSSLSSSVLQSILKFWTSSLLLQGQVAVITGGGGAIGFGIAKQLLTAGAVVVISDIDNSRLQKVHSLLAEIHDEIRVERIAFDVTDYQAVEKGFAEISRRLGGIDIVVPNAGIALVAKIEDLNPNKLDHVIAVKLK